MEREHFCARCQDPERAVSGWAQSPHKAAAAPASGSFDAKPPRTVSPVTDHLTGPQDARSYIHHLGPSEPRRREPLAPSQDRGPWWYSKTGDQSRWTVWWLPRGAYLTWTLKGVCSPNDRGRGQAAGEDAAPRDCRIRLAAPPPLSLKTPPGPSSAHPPYAACTSQAQSPPLTTTNW